MAAPSGRCALSQRQIASRIRKRRWNELKLVGEPHIRAGTNGRWVAHSGLVDACPGVVVSSVGFGKPMRSTLRRRCPDFRIDLETCNWSNGAVRYLPEAVTSPPKCDEMTARLSEARYEFLASPSESIDGRFATMVTNHPLRQYARLTATVDSKQGSERRGGGDARCGVTRRDALRLAKAADQFASLNLLARAIGWWPEH